MQSSIPESANRGQQVTPVLSVPSWQSKTPGEWAAEGDAYDCTCWVGPLWSDGAVANPAPWPMYSFKRPSTILWNAIAASLNRRGWSDERIKYWLQSKSPRWALDGELGDTLEVLGELFARSIDAEHSVAESST